MLISTMHRIFHNIVSFATETLNELMLILGKANKSRGMTYLYI